MKIWIWRLILGSHKMQCRKKFHADWKHNGSFLLNAPWQNPWSSGPWQNPWMLRFIISMGFAMELWENPWDTLIRPGHAVVTFKTCNQSDEETWPDQPKDTYISNQRNQKDLPLVKAGQNWVGGGLSRAQRLGGPEDPHRAQAIEKGLSARCSKTRETFSLGCFTVCSLNESEA